MEKMKGHELLFCLITLLCYTHADEISTEQLCGDESCEETISIARTIGRHSSSDDRFLNFEIGRSIRVQSKGAGDRPDLWSGELNGKRGYFPKNFVREYKILIHQPEHIVQTERGIELELLKDKYGDSAETAEDINDELDDTEVDDTEIEDDTDLANEKTDSNDEIEVTNQEVDNNDDITFTNQEADNNVVEMNQQEGDNADKVEEQIDEEDDTEVDDDEDKDETEAGDDEEKENENKEQVIENAEGTLVDMPSGTEPIPPVAAQEAGDNQDNKEKLVNGDNSEEKTQEGETKEAKTGEEENKEGEPKEGEGTKEEGSWWSGWFDGDTSEGDGSSTEATEVDGHKELLRQREHAGMPQGNVDDLNALLESNYEKNLETADGVDTNKDKDDLDKQPIDATKEEKNQVDENIGGAPLDDIDKTPEGNVENEDKPVKDNEPATHTDDAVQPTPVFKPVDIGFTADPNGAQQQEATTEETVKEEETDGTEDKGVQEEVKTEASKVTQDEQTQQEEPAEAEDLQRQLEIKKKQIEMEEMRLQKEKEIKELQEKKEAEEKLEEEKRLLEEQQKIEEERLQEEQRRIEEENKKLEEQKRIEEENKKLEEQKRIEEENRKLVEQKRIEEEKRKFEEQQKLEEEKRKLEEDKRIEEEKRLKDQQQAIEEKRLEEERLLKQKKDEEENRKQEEEKIKQEEEKIKQEEIQKELESKQQAEKEQLSAEEKVHKQMEEQRKQRIEEQKRIEERRREQELRREEQERKRYEQMRAREDQKRKEAQERKEKLLKEKQEQEQKKQNIPESTKDPQQEIPKVSETEEPKISEAEAESNKDNSKENGTPDVDIKPTQVESAPPGMTMIDGTAFPLEDFEETLAPSVDLKSSNIPVATPILKEATITSLAKPSESIKATKVEPFHEETELKESEASPVDTNIKATETDTITVNTTDSDPLKVDLPNLDDLVKATQAGVKDPYQTEDFMSRKPLENTNNQAEPKTNEPMDSSEDNKDLDNAKPEESKESDSDNLNAPDGSVEGNKETSDDASNTANEAATPTDESSPKVPDGDDLKKEEESESEDTQKNVETPETSDNKSDEDEPKENEETTAPDAPETSDNKDDGYESDKEDNSQKNLEPPKTTDTVETVETVEDIASKSEESTTSEYEEPVPPLTEETVTPPTILKEGDPFENDSGFQSRKIPDEAQLEKDENESDSAEVLETVGSGIHAVEGIMQPIVNLLPASMQGVLGLPPLRSALFLLIVLISSVVYTFCTCGSKKKGPDPLAEARKFEEKLYQTTKMNEALEEDNTVMKQQLMEYERLSKLMQEKVEKMKEREGKMRKEIDTLKVQNKDLTDSMGQYQEQLNTYAQTINQWEVAYKAKDAELTSEKEQMVQLQEHATALETQVQEMKDSMNESESTEDSLKSQIVNLKEEINQVQKTKSQLLDEQEDWKEKLKDLEEQCDQKDADIKTVQETISYKDNEIEVLKDCFVQLKALHEDKDAAEEENEEEAEKPKVDIHEKIQSMVDVSRIQARLNVVQEDRDHLSSQLRIERESRSELEDKVEKLKTELETLKEGHQSAEKSAEEAQTKLQVLNSYFKEKEIALQRELGEQEALRKRTEGTLSSIEKQKSDAVEEHDNVRLMLESIRKEMEESERHYKQQIAQQEKRAHENWIEQRKKERELKEEKENNAVLRQKLLETERKLDQTSREGLIRPLPRRDLPPLLNGPPPLDRPGSRVSGMVSPNSLRPINPPRPPILQPDLDDSSLELTDIAEHSRSGVPPLPEFEFRHDPYYDDPRDGSPIRDEDMDPLPPPIDRRFPPPLPPPHMRSLPPLGPPPPLGRRSPPMDFDPRRSPPDFDRRSPPLDFRGPPDFRGAPPPLRGLPPRMGAPYGAPPPGSYGLPPPRRDMREFPGERTHSRQGTGQFMEPVGSSSPFDSRPSPHPRDLGPPPPGQQQYPREGSAPPPERTSFV